MSFLIKYSFTICLLLQIKFLLASKFVYLSFLQTVGFNENFNPSVELVLL
jgi:hypothetical protein